MQRKQTSAEGHLPLRKGLALARRGGHLEQEVKTRKMDSPKIVLQPEVEEPKHKMYIDPGLEIVPSSTKSSCLWTGDIMELKVGTPNPATVCCQNAD